MSFNIDKYDARPVVCNFFEDVFMNVFDLKRVNIKSLGKVIDFISKDDSYFVEVKGSAYDNGGVIKEKQLIRYDKEVLDKRFYGFGFHSFSKRYSLQKQFPTKSKLKKALTVKSLYLIPFSIVKAHFSNSVARVHPEQDMYVQLDEKQSNRIFILEPEIWHHLNLDENNYRTIRPHENVFIITREGHLEKEILRSFNSEAIKQYV